MIEQRHLRRRPAAVAVRLALALGAGLVLAACSEREHEALHGYIEAELLHIAPVATGTLARVAVARGQRVDVGQPLFEMDGTPELHTAAAASARQDRASAQLANLRTGKRPLEIASLEQQVLQAGAALASSTSALQRQAQLVDHGFVSAARLDELATGTPPVCANCKPRWRWHGRRHGVTRSRRLTPTPARRWRRPHWPAGARGRPNAPHRGRAKSSTWCIGPARW
jgi:multidrug resistance efflux pump